MMLIVSIVAAALCLLLLIYPFILYPAVLRLFADRPVAHGDSGLSASLLFCAYNEGASLPAKIANLRALKARYPTLEILGFNDGSADETAALLDAAADILQPVHGPGRAGKARGMKTLVTRARGDVLIFTDANVLLDIDAVERLLSYYADPQIGGVLGSLQYEGADASASAQVGGYYWRIEERLKAEESRTGNVMGADGSIFSIRRALYPEFPDSVLDDMTVSMAVVFAGQRLIFAHDVIAREMMVARREDEMARKTRIAARAWHTHGYLRSELRRMAPLDRFKYISRKMLRWFGAFWIVGGALAVMTAAWTIAPMLALAVAFVGLLLLYIGLRTRRGPLAAMIDILLAYFATARGVALSIGGRDFTTWSPAKSRS